MITLNEQEQQKWNEEVLRCYPNEAVAIVVDGVVIPMENTAENPEETFSIKPAQFWQYKDQIQAVLHSHCHDLNRTSQLDPRIPSKKDMTGQINMGCWWGITATEGESTTDILWFGKDRELEYTGRPFIFNVNDCFELTRDYFRREFNYNIKPTVS